MPRGWSLLLAWVITGCAAAPPSHDGEEVLGYGTRGSSTHVLKEPSRRWSEERRGVDVAMVSPADAAMRAVASGAVRVDAFEQLLVFAGLGDLAALPPRGENLTSDEAARVLALLLKRPVTLANFPPRRAACHLLREVLEGDEISRDELLRRVERFSQVVVLRPDGYLAWVRSGRTQQSVAPVQWKEGSFRAGPFELGRFYSGRGGVFRRLDDSLREADSGVLAEVYDDADTLGRALDGAEEAFVELALAVGQLLTHPADSLAGLRHLPAALSALVASSPEYLERFRHMTRGEQVKALSKLTTTLMATWGVASGTTRTVTGALRGAEATVPVLSLSADGTLVMERIAVPVRQAATVLGGGRERPSSCIEHARRKEGPHPLMAPGDGSPPMRA